MKKNIVWQNYNYNIDDWKEFLDEEYPDVVDEYDKYMIIDKMNDFYLDDERTNLDITLKENIFIIANIGRWCGRRIGYKELGSNNIADCLRFELDCDFAEWYVDNYGRFCSRQTHHDGTHFLQYLAWKDGVTDEQKERVLDGIYSGRISKRTLRRYTENIGKYIANIYGWKICGRR